MYRPNLKYMYVVLPVPEIIAIGVLCGVANLQSAERRLRGSEMVPSERALVSSYRSSMQIIPLSAFACSEF